MNRPQHEIAGQGRSEKRAPETKRATRSPERGAADSRSRVTSSWVRRLWLGFAILLSASTTPAAAQTADGCPPPAASLTPERVQAGMAAAKDHGFLWRITKGDHASYLYGTIHASRLEWMFPGPTILDALRASDTVALELDVLDPQIQSRLGEAMASTGGAPLPAPLQARLQRQMKAECVASDALAKLSPELQLASLTLTAARRDGIDPTYSIDLMLAGYGRGAGKTMVSLETPEEQLDALKSTDAAETSAVVAQTLDDLESGRARPMMRRVASMWAEGNRAELESYEQWCGCRDTPAERLAMKRLLDDRNPLLAERIDALHGEGRKVFAAVGSLHMVGPQGLPALLIQRGFKVEAGDFER
jgi:uncharacterized protein YbaP (TraB family)